MHNKLQNMEDSKREKLINAIIDEFSRYPFDKASTNNIAKSAGISKGLIFHYFENKQELYDATLAFTIDKIKNDIEKEIDWDETNLFERIKQIALVKMRVGKMYPKLFDFMVRFMKEDSENMIPNELFDKYEQYGIDIRGLFEKVYHYNIDYSRFADKSKIKEHIEIVQWTMEGISMKIVDQIGELSIQDSMLIALEEIEKYIDVLKKAFYKSEVEE